MEAAHALGLNTLHTNLYIVLPQARAVLAQPTSFGASLEVYVLIAAVFFVLSYAISQASYRLERALGVGTR